MIFSTLNIWVLSDKTAGHMAGSRGLAKAFEKIHPANVTWIDTELRLSGAHRLLTPALNYFPGTWSERWIKLFYHIENMPDGTPDIICSAGRKTQYLNVLWARQYAAKNFFVGTLRDLPSRHFTGFLTPLEIDEPNHIHLDLPLTDVDAAALAEAEQPYKKAANGQPIWALLVGGKTPGYRFEREDWLNLGRTMRRLSEQHGGKWLLTTSRRTGENVEEILRATVPSEHIIDSVWYADAPRKVVKSFLSSAEAVFCTEDSMAMLGEAVAAGRPVYSLRPQDTKLDWKETQIISNLEEGKKIHRFTLSDLANGRATLPPKSTFELFTTSPLDDVAAKLKPFLK